MQTKIQQFALTLTLIFQADSCLSSFSIDPNSHPLLFEAWAEQQEKAQPTYFDAEEYVEKQVDAYAKSFQKATRPDKRADLLVSLKEDISGLAITEDLSKRAIELYQEQEATLARQVDPMMTSVEYFDRLTSEQFRKVYLDFLDTKVDEYKQLLTLRSISKLYSKIADVYKMDGLVSQADKYYTVAGKVLIDGLYEYEHCPHLASTLRQVAKMLKKTSTYGNAGKPLLAWCLDTFKTRKQDLANKIFDMILCSDVESIPASAVFQAGYQSFLNGDTHFAGLYLFYAPFKMDGKDPMSDSNAKPLERIANQLATDVLLPLINTGKLEANAPALVQKWNQLLAEQSFHLTRTHRLETIWGVLNKEDLKDGNTLLSQIQSLHGKLAFESK